MANRKKGRKKKKKDLISSSKLGLCLVVIFFIGLLVSYTYYECSQATNLLDVVIKEKLNSSDLISTQTKPLSHGILKIKTMTKRYFVSNSNSADKILGSLKSSLKNTDIQIKHIEKDRDHDFEQIIFLKYAFPVYNLELENKKTARKAKTVKPSVKKTKPQVKVSSKKPVKKAEPKIEPVKKQTASAVVYPIKPSLKQCSIAIVLDDWGYSMRNKEFIQDINRPLTLAVLPDPMYSKKVAELAHEQGMEVILHMPMEPLSKLNKYEESTIFTDMPDEQVRLLLNHCLDSIPFVTGMNNHQGSKATTDERILAILMEELKKRDLFFLDSLSNPQSIGYETAKKMNIPSAKRSIFLDNDSDEQAIRDQLYKLFEQAKIKGYAIGIGHDRPNTVNVLKELMPELEKKGVKFVKLSELIEKDQRLKTKD